MAKEENRARKGEFHLLHEHSGFARVLQPLYCGGNHLVGVRSGSLLGISTDLGSVFSWKWLRKEKETALCRVLAVCQALGWRSACIIFL